MLSNSEILPSLLDPSSSSVKMSSRALRRLEKASIEDELAKITGLEAGEAGRKGKGGKGGKSGKTSKKVNAFALLEEEGDEEDTISDDSSPDKDTVAKDDSPRDTKDTVNTDGDANKDTVHNDDASSDTSSNDGSFQDAVEYVPRRSKKGKKGRKKAKNTQIDDLNEDELDKLLAEVRINDDKREETRHVENEQTEYTDDPSPIYTPGGRLFTVGMFERCRQLVSADRRYLDPDKEYEALFGKLSNAAIDDADSTASSFVTPEILKQIKKLSKRVRGWGGRDRRSVPGTTRKLVLTKIRDDWLPTNRKPLVMDELTDGEIKSLFEQRYPNDWRDAVLEQIAREKKAGIKYFRLSEGPLYSRLLTTEFFISVAIQPDHESIIQLLQKAPYHLESILQVASILQRQGDNSNTNGLIERALFIFDWSLKNTFDLSSGNCRLPFEEFFNRQVYLTVFRYITVLTKKSTFFTALNYCKLLLSFDPADDPYGVRYFIDFYAFMSGDYQYLVDFFESSLTRCYEEWSTPSLCYTVAFCLWKLNKKDEAKEALENAVKRHPYTGGKILEKLGGREDSRWSVSTSVEIATAIYTVRIDALLEEPELKKFVKDELERIQVDGKSSYLDSVEEIPRNLLRFVILSNETSAMAKIPPQFWSENDVYEFDLLPPKEGSKVYDYVDENKVAEAVIGRSMQVVDRGQ
ncbi:DEKNAAC104316 [Brettanomyces naardenensis]|uniref:DEKNAAC104316 n=1 Tax=Brettanomyces naardenensis TaxID=13370 RepID=A0A448YQI4_BRENA|nr:DEKNAAC104316 [Brettanomyces naardenensis]